MKVKENYQSLQLNNLRQFNEDDEGGLDLGQILAIIRRQAFLVAGITCGVMALATIKALNAPPIYQSHFEILIQPATAEADIISSTDPNSPGIQNEVVNVRDEAVLKILKSPEILNPIVNELQPQFPSINYGRLFRNLKISTIGQELQVITVSYQDLDPKLVKSALDKISQAYLEYSQQSRESSIRRGIEFVDTQLPLLRKRVQSLEMNLQKIRQENNLVNPEMKGQELANSLSGFRQQELQNQLQIKEAKELYASLQKELAQPSVELSVSSLLNQSSRYQNLLNQLQEIDSQIAKDSVLLFEESPEITILKNQRQSLLPLVRQEGQRIAREKANEIRALEARTQILNETISSLNEQLKQVSVILRDYTEIQRELRISNESLNKFLSEREALRIDISQTANPFRLLVTPQEPGAISASITNNLVLGMILGLLLGIGAALVLDKSRGRLYTVKDIKEVTQLPILGVIPFENEVLKLTTTPRKSNFFDQINQVNGNLSIKNGRKFHESNGSGFREAFRSIYTNIRFVKLDSPTNSLVVSSATPAEGKSTVAINLAQAAATLGQRVLLVDADFREPSLHKSLKLPDIQGLTDILSLESLDLNTVIKRSSLEDNLFILTAGSSSVDSTKLLASKKMQDFRTF